MSGENVDLGSRFLIAEVSERAARAPRPEPRSATRSPRTCTAALKVKENINRRLATPDYGLFRRSIMSPEMAEGFQAFFEKRPPRWQKG